MDLLDRVLAPSSDLLDRVDAMLTRHGAPGNHPVWRELARAGALPSSAAAQIADLAPERMRSLAAQLGSTADGLGPMVDSVPPGLISRGLAAEGFADSWGRLAAQIDTAPGAAPVAGDASLVDRISATVAALDDVAAWAAAARRDLAGELGACLGSAEAVLVRSAGDTPDVDAIAAAADIAVHVLGSVTRSIEDGWHRFGRWSGINAESPLRPILATNAQVGHHIELH